MEFLYRDFELKKLCDDLEDCHKLIRIIRNRFESKKTDVKSFSMTQARKAVVNFQLEPQVYYNLRFRSHTLCITLSRGKYHLYCSDRSFIFKYVKVYLDEADAGCLYGEYSDIFEALPFFGLMISCYMSFICGDFDIVPRGLF